MPIIRAQATFQRIGNLAEDRYINTFYFNAPDGAAATLDLCGQTVTEFYGAVATGNTLKLDTFLSGVIDRTAGVNKVKVYNMADPQPRQPRDYPFGALTATTDPALPDEVAVCLSFYASRNLPKRRGRIYFGPLNTDAANTTGSTNSRPNQTLITHLVNAAKALKVSSASRGIPWIVNTSDLFLLPADRAVTHAWVDDAFDTQRRRGVKTSARTLLTL